MNNPVAENNPVKRCYLMSPTIHTPCSLLFHSIWFPCSQATVSFSILPPWATPTPVADSRLSSMQSTQCFSFRKPVSDKDFPYILHIQKCTLLRYVRLFFLLLFLEHILQCQKITATVKFSLKCTLTTTADAAYKRHPQTVTHKARQMCQLQSTPSLPLVLLFTTGLTQLLTSTHFGK